MMAVWACTVYEGVATPRRVYEVAVAAARLFSPLHAPHPQEAEVLLRGLAAAGRLCRVLGGYVVSEEGARLVEPLAECARYAYMHAGTAMGRGGATLEGDTVELGEHQRV